MPTLSLPFDGPSVYSESLCRASRPEQRITVAEIQTAFDRQGVPPILSLEEAAKIIKLMPSTVKRKASEGHFKGCVSRGKPLRFWRDRLIDRVMNKPE
jgi:hypothetical protein